MARQQTSNKNKEQNIRLPLIGSMTNRDYTLSKDQRFVNIFPETRKVEQIESTKIFLNKRPGLTLHNTLPAGVGRGLIYFNNHFYSVIGNTVREDNTTKITLSTSTGHVGMIVGNSSTIGNYLFICDGINGYFIDTTGTVTTIDPTSVLRIFLTAAGTGYTDGSYSLGFSGGGGSGAAGTYTVVGNVVTSITLTNSGTGYTGSPTITFPSGGGTGAAATVILNAFPTPHIPTPSFIDGYICLAKGSDVYNCDLDEPSGWDPSNYISAEMFPDSVTSLARQNNQVVVFGDNSTEFFYDAANPSASPLSRNEGTVLQVGIASPYAVYQTEKTLIFIGQSDSGGRGVWMVDGFTSKKVSDEYIDRIIDKETNVNQVRGYGIRLMGHLFFVINMSSLGRTLVYDVDEKLWHEWSTSSGSTHTVFSWDYATDNHTGKTYLLNKSTGQIAYLDTTVYTDIGSDIIVDLTTNKYDMDTIRRKFQSNVRIVGDRYTAGTSIDLKWTDDDYQTWSNVKTISLSDDFPNFARMGMFRRRAYNLKYIGNSGLRLESLEITFKEGDS